MDCEGIRVGTGLKNQIEAAHWLQNQEGLKILIGKNGSVTVTDGVEVEYTGIGFTGVFNGVQNILRTIEKNEQNPNQVCN